MDSTLITWIILGVSAPIALGLVAFVYSRGRGRSEVFAELRSLRANLRARLENLNGRRDAAIGYIQSEFKRRYDQTWSRISHQTSIRQLSDFGASGARFSALEAYGYTTVADLDRILRSGTNLQNIDGVGPTSAERLRHGYQSFWNQTRAAPLRLPPPEEAGELAGVYQAAAVATFYEREVRTPWSRTRSALDAVEIPGFGECLFSSMEDLERRAEEISSKLGKLEPEVEGLESMYEQFREEVDRQGFVVEYLHSHTNDARGYLQSSPGDGYPPPKLVSGTPAITDSAERARDEHEFENTVVTRVLENLRVNFERQYPVKLQVGSRETRGFIDVVIYRDERIISLIESKRSITTEKELERARDQALSYAVKLRIASFAVASAEGFWVYELPRHRPTLAFHIETAELRHRAQEIVDAMHEFDARHLG